MPANLKCCNHDYRAVKGHQFLRIFFEVQDQFDVVKSMQETGVHHVHHVRKIQGAIHAFRPTPISAKKLSGPRIPNNRFIGSLNIHAI